ncbi:hypothetical protein RJ641_027060 [Dillenia turbinata]|uniref:Uncharacterized protein n=1 Tax=Dillenia turbinata TaxID=194707 RepID=A0AAN8W845_9MAGN
MQTATIVDACGDNHTWSIYWGSWGHAFGYAIVFISSICVAIYLTSIAPFGSRLFSCIPFFIFFSISIMRVNMKVMSVIFIGKASGLNSLGLMWCNELKYGPILLVCASVRGDLGVVMKFPLPFSPDYTECLTKIVTLQDLLTNGIGWLLFGGLPFDLAVLLLSRVIAFLLNYAMFLNRTSNSALTKTVCDNLKYNGQIMLERIVTLQDLLTNGIGWLLFGGLPFDLDFKFSPHSVCDNLKVRDGWIISMSLRLPKVQAELMKLGEATVVVLDYPIISGVSNLTSWLTEFGILPLEPQNVDSANLKELEDT